MARHGNAHHPFNGGVDSLLPTWSA